MHGELNTRPIIFSTASVEAIVAGRKTQTRRVMLPQPDNPETEDRKRVNRWLPCPFGSSGDLLWTRETFREFDDGDVYFKADFGASIPVHGEDEPGDWRWQSPLFMPRRLARIWLEITGVRVQRVQDISEEDAMAEGVFLGRFWTADLYQPARAAYAKLWDSLNSKRGFPWSSNPWVWAVSFRRIPRP